MHRLFNMAVRYGPTGALISCHQGDAWHRCIIDEMAWLCRNFVNGNGLISTRYFGMRPASWQSNSLADTLQPRLP